MLELSEVLPAPSLYPRMVHDIKKQFMLYLKLLYIGQILQVFHPVLLKCIVWITTVLW